MQRKRKPKLTGLPKREKTPGGDCTKKTCPVCKAEHGVAKGVCPCGHNFRQAKSNKVEEQREELKKAGGVTCVSTHMANIQRLVRNY